MEKATTNNNKQAVSTSKKHDKVSQTASCTQVQFCTDSWFICTEALRIFRLTPRIFMDTTIFLLHHNIFAQRKQSQSLPPQGESNQRSSAFQQSRDIHHGRRSVRPTQVWYLLYYNILINTRGKVVLDSGLLFFTFAERYPKPTKTTITYFDIFIIRPWRKLT